MISALYDQHALTLYKVICCHVRNPTEAAKVLEYTFKEICAQAPPVTLVTMAGIARRLARQVNQL